MERIGYNVSIPRWMRDEIKEIDLPEGLKLSHVFKWIMKAALAEKNGISDAVFQKEMDADRQGRLVHEFIKTYLKKVIKAR